MTAEKQEELIVCVSKGRSKRSIAERLKVDQQTVARFISTEPGLADVWTRNCASRLLHQRRAMWRRATRLFGELGVKMVRQNASATYAWLYRHDRTWLVQHNSAYVVSKRSNNSNIDWCERDERLHESVYRAICTDFGTLADCERTLGKLCELVPELRAKVAKLDRLPRTAYLVSESVKSSDQFGNAAVINSD